MPTDVWGRLTDPWDDPWGSLEKSLEGQAEGSYGITPLSGGRRSISIYGQGRDPFGFEAELDPLTNRFVVSGQLIHPSLRAGESGGISAMSGLIGRMIDEPPPDPSTSFDPYYKTGPFDPHAYARRQMPEGGWTGGQVFGPWSQMETTRAFIGSHPLKETQAGPQWAVQGAYPTSHYLPQWMNRQAHGWEYGPISADISSLLALPGYDVRGTSVYSPYKDAKARERLDWLDPGRTPTIHGGQQETARLRGVASGAETRTGIGMWQQFVPGLPVPGEGQSFYKSSAFAGVGLGTNKLVSQRFAYRDMAEWAEGGGKTMTSIDTTMYDRQQSVGASYLSVMGEQVGIPGDKLRGAEGYIPGGARWQMPMGEGLYSVLQQMAGPQLEAARKSGAQQGGFSVNVLQNRPQTKPQEAAYRGWLHALGATNVQPSSETGDPLGYRIGGGLPVDYTMSGRYPQLQMGIEAMYSMQSGTAMYAPGLKSVGLGMKTLTGMGADPRAEMVYGAGSAKGLPALVSGLAQTLEPQDWAPYLGKEWQNYFDPKGNMIWGGPAVTEATTKMIGSKEFPELMRSRGGDVLQGWWKPPGFQQSIPMLQRTGQWDALLARGGPEGGPQVRPEEGGGGDYEIYLKSVLMRGTITPHSLFRGQGGQLSFSDLMEIGRYNPEALPSLMRGDESGTREANASVLLAAGGRGRIPEKMMAPAHDPFLSYTLPQAEGGAAAPLRDRLEAMAGEQIGKEYIPLGSVGGREQFLPPAKHLLNVLSGAFSSKGRPISSFGRSVEGALNVLEGGVDVPEALATYSEAHAKFASQPEVVKKAFGGPVGGSVWGRATYAAEAGMKQGEFAMILPGEFASKMDIPSDSQLAMMFRAPFDVNKAASKMVGRVMDINSYNTMAQKMGWDELDPAHQKQGNIIIAGNITNVAEGTLFDVDKDIVSAFLVNNLPNTYNAASAMMEAVTGSKQFLDTHGKGRESLENVGMDVETWAGNKMPTGYVESEELRRTRGSSAELTAKTGLASNMGSYMSFYTDKFAEENFADDPEKMAKYKASTRIGMEALGSMKQSAIDVKAGLYDKRMDRLLSPMTMAVFAGQGPNRRVTDITMGTGGYREVGKDVIPGRSRMRPIDLLAGVGRAGLMLPLIPPETPVEEARATRMERLKGVASWYGGYVEEGKVVGVNPEVASWLEKEAYEPLSGGAVGVGPGGAEKILSGTPIWDFSFGRGLVNALGFAEDVTKKLGAGEESAAGVPKRDIQRAVSALGFIETGAGDPQMATYLQATAATKIGSRAGAVRRSEARGGLGLLPNAGALLNTISELREQPGLVGNLLKQMPIGQWMEEGRAALGSERALTALNQLAGLAPEEAPAATAQTTAQALGAPPPPGGVTASAGVRRGPSVGDFETREGYGYRYPTLTEKEISEGRRLATGAPSGSTLSVEIAEESTQQYRKEGDHWRVLNDEGEATGWTARRNKEMGARVQRGTLTYPGKVATSAGATQGAIEQQRITRAMDPDQDPPWLRQLREEGDQISWPFMESALRNLYQGEGSPDQFREMGLGKVMEIDDYGDLLQGISSGRGPTKKGYDRMKRLRNRMYAKTPGWDPPESEGILRGLNSWLNVNKTQVQGAQFAGRRMGVVEGAFQGGMAGLGMSNVDMELAGLSTGQIGNVDRSIGALFNISASGGYGTLAEKQQLIRTQRELDLSDPMAQERFTRLQSVIGQTKWGTNIPRLTPEQAAFAGGRATKIGETRAGVPGMGYMPRFGQNVKEATTELQKLIAQQKTKGELNSKDIAAQKANLEDVAWSGPRNLRKLAGDLGYQQVVKGEPLRAGVAEAVMRDPIFTNMQRSLQEKAGIRAEGFGLAVAEAGMAAQPPVGGVRGALAGMGAKLGRGAKMLSFWDLMYMQRVGQVFWGGFQKQAGEAEQMDMLMQQQMAQMGVGGVPQLGPTGESELAKQQAGLYQGRAFSQAYGPMMNAMAGGGGILGPLPGIIGPAIGAGLIASYWGAKIGMPQAGIPIGIGVGLTAMANYATAQEKEGASIAWEGSRGKLGQFWSRFRYGAGMIAGTEAGWSGGAPIGGSVSPEQQILQQDLQMGEAQTAFWDRGGIPAQALLAQESRYVGSYIAGGAEGLAKKGMFGVPQYQQMLTEMVQYGGSLKVGPGGMVEGEEAIGLAENFMMIYGRSAGEALPELFQEIYGEPYVPGDPRAQELFEDTLKAASDDPKKRRRYQTKYAFAKTFGGAISSISQSLGLGPSSWSPDQPGQWNLRDIERLQTRAEPLAAAVQMGWITSEQAGARVFEPSGEPIALDTQGATTDILRSNADAAMRQRFGKYGMAQTGAGWAASQVMLAGRGAAGGIEAARQLSGRETLAIQPRGDDATSVDVNALYARAAGGDPYAQAALAMAPGNLGPGLGALWSGYDVVTGTKLFERAGAPPQGLFTPGTQAQASGFGQAFGLEAGGALLQGWMGAGGGPGGEVGLQRAYKAESLALSQASLGNQAAMMALRYKYTTGEGMPGGRGFWQIEDDTVALSRQQQDYSWMMGGQRMDVQQAQFGANWGAQYEQFQQQTVWQQEDFATRAGRMGQVREWGREDWGRQDDLRATQWGWQMEDMQENIRFTTGRERRRAVEERGRAVIMHGAEGEQIDIERQRQEEKWSWEEEDFNKQQARAEQSNQWREESFERQKQHFEENMEMNREAHEMQKQFMDERRALEDEQRALSREYFKESHALQLQGLGIQAEQMELQEEMYRHTVMMDEFWVMLNLIQAQVANGTLEADDAAQQLESNMKTMFSDIPVHFSITSDGRIVITMDGDGNAGTGYGGNAGSGSHIPTGEYPSDPEEDPIPRSGGGGGQQETLAGDDALVEGADAVTQLLKTLSGVDPNQVGQVEAILKVLQVS